MLWPTPLSSGYSSISEIQIFWFAYFYEKQNIKSFSNLIALSLWSEKKKYSHYSVYQKALILV